MPRNFVIVFTLIFCSLFSLQSVSADKPDHSVDICIYGGTSGGVVAAVKAAGSENMRSSLNQDSIWEA